MRSQFHVAHGTYEREIAAPFREFAAKTKSFYDIGAAEGYYSVYMAHNTDAKITAFEPLDESRAFLEKNLAKNAKSEDHYEIRDIFVSDESGDNATTIDDVAKDAEGPIFLKIDIEGAEVQALKGATETLKRDDVHLIVEVHGVEEEKFCVETLQAAGYKTQINPQAWWRCILKEARHLDHNHWLIAEKS